MKSLNAFAAAKLATLHGQNLHRRLTVSDRTDSLWITRGGERLLSFSCNDYLNLSQHPEIIEAAIAATRRFGTGAGSARLVTGNHPLFAQLETRLAAHKGTEAACIFGSGYLANAGIIPTLAGPPDLLLIDELAHACSFAGATISHATTLSFRHNDTAHLAQLLAAHRSRHRHALILTETVFSMDGDRAPLPTILSLGEDHDAWTMTDDAHGLGVVTLGGNKPPLQMGTLSKAIGAYGGYLCATAPVIDLMRNRARSFIYSTGLPPGTVAAAIAALDFIAAEPAYCARPLARARQFTAALNLPAAASPIVPLIIGSAAAALEASAQLAAAGFLVAAIRPPTVPANTARLRFTFSALHDPDDITRLTDFISTRLPLPVRNNAL